MTENVKEAARRLLAHKIALGYVPRALHEYVNPDGMPIYWRARLEHPDGDSAPEGRKIIRPLYLNGSGYRLGEPPFSSNLKPLYNLDRIAAEDTARVWIVEGEKAADALTTLGAVATTSGGADSAGTADWSPLAGRECILWADRDDAGRAYMGDVAAALGPLGCRLSAIDLDALALPPKGDAADWVAVRSDATLGDLDALPRLAARTDDPRASEAVSGLPVVELICAADVESEAVRWLWPDWIAAGKLAILAGPPGTGKTTLALALAATITNGGRWPDGSHATPADVFIWSGEDGVADTLAPRLIANGADGRRIQFVRTVAEQGGRRPFDPATDVPALALAFARRPSPPALLIVDSLVSVVRGDSHKNAETRRDLQPLVGLGERFGCGILGIMHYAKGTGGRDPVERVVGSIAFSALARVVLAAVKTTTPDGMPGPRLFARAKNNLGPDSGGFHYSIEQLELPGKPGIRASRLLWGEAVEGEARALLAAAEQDPSSDAAIEQRDATAWLQELLADGPLPARNVRRHADEAGIAWRTAQRAVRRPEFLVERTGFGGGSIWSLAAHSRHSRQPLEVGANGANGWHGANGPALPMQSWRVVRADGDAFNVTTNETVDEMRERYPGASLERVNAA